MRGVVLKFVVVPTMVLLSFVAMYVYGDSVCIPAQQTKDFCPTWIAEGMFFPALLWLGVWAWFDTRS